MTIADIRTDYRRASLSEQDVADDPIAQFTRWFDEAVKAAVLGSTANAVLHGIHCDVYTVRV